jgi:hypothetical protein
MGSIPRQVHAKHVETLLSLNLLWRNAHTNKSISPTVQMNLETDSSSSATARHLLRSLVSAVLGLLQRDALEKESLELRLETQHG